MENLRHSGRGRSRRTAGAAPCHLPSCQRGKPARRPRVHRRARPGRNGLQGPRVLGHRYFHVAVFHTHLSRGSAGASHVSIPHSSRRASQGRAPRLSRRSLCCNSTDSGEEVTPPFVVAPDGEVIRILTGEQEQHSARMLLSPSGVIWEATEDQCFLIEAGAETSIETARFGQAVSRAKRTAATISGVSSGPTKPRDGHDNA